jgi:hypothetical protein
MNSGFTILIFLASHNTFLTKMKSKPKLECCTLEFAITDLDIVEEVVDEVLAKEPKRKLRRRAKTP